MTPTFQSVGSGRESALPNVVRAWPEQSEEEGGIHPLSPASLMELGRLVSSSFSGLGCAPSAQTELHHGLFWGSSLQTAELRSWESSASMVVWAIDTHTRVSSRLCVSGEPWRMHGQSKILLPHSGLWPTWSVTTIIHLLSCLLFPAEGQSFMMINILLCISSNAVSHLAQIVTYWIQTCGI